MINIKNELIKNNNLRKNVNIKYVWRITKKTLIYLTSVILLYLFATLILSWLPTNPDKKVCEDPKIIYISTNGVHLNIIIKNQDLSSALKQQLEISGQTPYVSFGWGDQGFYLQTPQWKNLKISIAFKALFMKSKTAMHVIRYPRKFSSWIEVKVCHEQLSALLYFISNSFKKNPQGEISKIDVPGYTSYDSFYQANGSYTLFYTCNNWVNEALKEADVKTSLWSPLDKGVLYHLNKRE